MARFLIKRREKKGISPGQPIFIGKQEMDETLIRLMDFSPATFDEKVINNVNEITPFIETKSKTWMNIDGLHDTKVIEDLGNVFSLNPLLLEDLVNTGQRPKIEEYNNCIFIVLKMLKYNSKTSIVKAEHVNFIITENVLITLQEKTGDVFDPVRQRIRNKKKRIINMGTDYLCYALLDIIVDNYIDVIESLGSEIEDLEQRVLNEQSYEIIEKINNYKKEINYLRKFIRPTKECILRFSKSEADLIKSDLNFFLADLKDHITQANEALDTYNDLLSDYINIYHANLSSKMNDIMKVLTIFSAVFIPLTFIAGIYGTNFEYVPELKYKYSYFIMWIVMIIVSVGMLSIFKKKKWL